MPASGNNPNKAIPKKDRKKEKEAEAPKTAEAPKEEKKVEAPKTAEAPKKEKK